MIHKAIHTLKAPADQYEDLFQEGSLIFYEALEVFDPEKGANFGTVLWTHLKKLHYRYWYKFQDKAYKFKLVRDDRSKDSGSGLHDGHASQEDRGEAFDNAENIDLNIAYSELSEDAKKIYSVIVSGNLVTALGRQLRLTIDNLLNIVSEWGWDKKRLQRALGDLRYFIYEKFDAEQDPVALCYSYNKL